jgi:hypothetical protein
MALGTKAKLYIFNQLWKANEDGANKCHALVNAFDVSGK